MKIQMNECLKWGENTDEILSIKGNAIGTSKSNWFNRLISRLFNTYPKVDKKIANEVLNELKANFSNYNANEALRLCLNMRNFTKHSEIRAGAEKILEEHLTPEFAANDLNAFGDKRHEQIGFIKTRNRGIIPITQPKKEKNHHENTLLQFFKSHLEIVDLESLLRIKLYLKENLVKTQIDGLIQAKATKIALETIPEIRESVERVKSERITKTLLVTDACRDIFTRLATEKDTHLLYDTVILCADGQKLYFASDVLREIPYFVGFFDTSSTFTTATPHNPEDLQHLSPEARLGTTDQNHYVSLENFSKEAIAQMISYVTLRMPLSEDLDRDLLLEIMMLADFVGEKSLAVEAENLLTKDIDAEGIRVLLTYPQTYSDQFYKMLANRNDLLSLWPINNYKTGHHVSKLYGYGVKSEVLFELMRISGFRPNHIYLTGNALNAGGIDKIIRLIPWIEYIYLNEGSLSKADIEKLSSLKNLKKLELKPSIEAHPSIVGLQSRLLNQQIKRFEKRCRENKPYEDLKNSYAECKCMYSETYQVDYPNMEIALANNMSLDEYFELEIDSFAQLMKPLETDAGTRQDYQRWTEAFAKLPFQQKKEALGAVTDSLLKRAMEEGMPFEEFEKAKQEDLKALSHDPVDLTNSNPSVESLVKAESVQLSLSDIPDLIDRFKEYQERQEKAEKNLELKRDQLIEWNTQLEKCNSELEQLQARTKTPKIEAAIKAKKNEILKLRIAIKKVESTESISQKNPSLKYLRVVLDKDAHLIDRKAMQSIKEIEGLCGHPVRVLWSNDNNTSLTLENANVSIPNIKELKVVGNENLNRILIHYPRVHFLDLSSYIGSVDVDAIFSKCPDLRCVRWDKVTVRSPASNVQRNSFANIDNDTAKKFLTQLRNNSLPEDLKADSAITIGGTPHAYHTAVLANCSHVFRELQVLEMNEIQSFDSVLEYAYTGNVNISGMEQALQLVDAAEALQMPGLMQVAQDYVQSHIDSSNWKGYAPTGSHAKLMIRLFCEANPKLDGAKTILDKPFPIVQAVPPIVPLSIDTKEFSDYSIQVEDKEFFLHKAILASRNSYYYSYFNEGLSQHEAAIERKDVDAHAQSVVLENIYGKSYSFENTEEARNILWVAEHDQVQPLKKIAFDFIASRLIPDENRFRIAKTKMQKEQIWFEFMEYFEFCNKYSEVEAYKKGMESLNSFANSLMMSRFSIDIVQNIRNLLKADVPFNGKRELIEKIDEYLARQFA